MGKDELSYALGSTVLEPPRFVLMAQSPQLGKATRLLKKNLILRSVHIHIYIYTHTNVHIYLIFCFVVLYVV